MSLAMATMLRVGQAECVPLAQPRLPSFAPTSLCPSLALPFPACLPVRIEHSLEFVYLSAAYQLRCLFFLTKGEGGVPEGGDDGFVSPAWQLQRCLYQIVFEVEGSTAACLRTVC